LKIGGTLPTIFKVDWRPFLLIPTCRRGQLGKKFIYFSGLRQTSKLSRILARS
jgi:hypothetical protein